MLLQCRCQMRELPPGVRRTSERRPSSLPPRQHQNEVSHKRVVRRLGQAPSRQRLPAQLPAAADVSVPSNWGTDTSRRTRTRRNARRELGQGKQRGKRSASAAVPSHPNMNFGYAAILLIQLHVFNVEMPFAAAVQVTTHEQLLDFGLPFHGRICVRDTVLLMLVQLRVPRCSF